MRTALLFLLVCASALSAQTPGQFYRPPADQRLIVNVRGDTIWYRVTMRDSVPVNETRIYRSSRATWDAGRWTLLGAQIDTVPPVVPPDTARPPVVADTAYPNRPAGLTLIGRNLGTVKDAGGAFGIAGFGPWYDHNVASDIAVVADPTNPTGSGQSLRFTYPSNDSKAGSATAGRFNACPCRELYILVRIFHESGFADFGNKFFYVGAQSGQRLNASSPTQFYADRNGSRLRIVNQNGQSVVAAYIDNAIALGKWQTLEFLLTGETAVGAGDGRARIWVDGRQVANDRVTWGATAFDGMEWYAEVNRIPTTSHYKLGELYIAGRR